MIREGKVWMGVTDDDRAVYILPKMANRHGLIAGATGTGKTVTLKVMAESFSSIGVPVFMADVKGDIAGLMLPGTDAPEMRERIERMGLSKAGFTYHGSPVTLWDIFGKGGIQLRTTITETGPVLLSRILGLNELQSSLLAIIFKIADDQGLLLIDTKDLKACVNYVHEGRKEFEAEYGKMSAASLAAITRAVVALEIAGGDVFFGEPALSIGDWMRVVDGRGVINVLASESLINNGRLYSAFLLFMMSELFETLPEVGDLAKPKMVFFFDEAHLLFDGATKPLLEKIEQVVKLIRSKGVGIYFCTQNPRDIPDGVLAQLGNKIQHGLRAYTPAEERAIKAAAAAFRKNPAFDSAEAITSLGTGRALVSFLDEGGVPTVAERVSILPPSCSMGGISCAERAASIEASPLYAKYAEGYDPDSAYEFLMRRGEEAAAELARREADAAREREEAAAAKARAKEEERAAKAREREEAEREREAKARAKEEERLAKERAREEERAAKEAEKAREKEIRAAKREADRLAREEARRLEREQKEAERQKKASEKATSSMIKSVGGSILGTLGRAAGGTVGKSVGGTFGKSVGGNIGASLARGIFGTLFKG